MLHVDKHRRESPPDPAAGAITRLQAAFAATEAGSDRITRALAAAGADGADDRSRTGDLPGMPANASAAGHALVLVEVDAGRNQLPLAD